MKNIYKLLKADGQVIDIDQNFKFDGLSNDLKKIIDVEVFSKYSAGKESQYIEIANKFGFSWEKNSEIGFINYGHKANLMKSLVEAYARQLVNQIGYNLYEVRGSNFFNMRYEAVQSYAQLFAERMFKHEDESKSLVMSYDASYPQFNLASGYQVSHKQMPYAHFSIADCYRNEQSGECMLLFRGKRFFMPDLHPYHKNINEAFEWYFKIEEQLKSSFNSANRSYENVVKVSSLDNWEKYKSKISAIAFRNNKDMLIEIRNDGQERYWIIDVDYSIVDAFGQHREIGCIQIDIGNAKRLGISYLDEYQNKVYPVIIHAAVPGGIERFLYMVIDQFPKFMPVWLYPVQVRLLPISDKYIEVCEQLLHKYSNVRIEIDDLSEPISRKLKRAHEDLVFKKIVVGEKEVSEDLDSINKQLDELQNVNVSNPYMEIAWPKRISAQIR